jgi:hypothetical protein
MASDTITMNGRHLDAEDVLAAIEEADGEEVSENIEYAVGQSGDVRVIGDGFPDREVDVIDIGGTFERVGHQVDPDDLKARAEDVLDTSVEPSDVSEMWLHAWTRSQDAYLPIDSADAEYHGENFSMSRDDDATTLSHDFNNDYFSGVTFSATGVERVDADDVPFDDISDHYDA